EARVVARTNLQHLLPLAVLPDVKRRRRDVGDELGAGEGEVGGRRPGLPDVLADRRPDDDVAEPQQEEIAPGREVAILVEDAVVRQIAFAEDRAGIPVSEREAGDEEAPLEVGRTDERR